MYRRTTALASFMLPTLALFVTSGYAAQRFDLGAIETVEVTGERPADSDWITPIEAVLSHEDLLDYERYDVADAVNLLPGVSVQNVGGRSERLIFVRGFNSRQVPLFIDGIPVYVPYDGNVDLGRFTSFDIEEINVTKSFTSVLYGANTLGGSVNLVSRRPAEELELEMGGGLDMDDDFDTSQYRTFANAGTNQGTWYLQGGASFTERNHFLLGDEFVPTAGEDGGRRDNSETQDYKYSVKVGFTPNESDEYAISYMNQKGDKETPPYAGTNPAVRARYWQWPEWNKESVYFLSNTTLGETSYIKLKAYYDSFDNTLRSFDNASYTTQFRPFAFNSIYDDYTWGGGIELGNTFAEIHDVRLAVNYKRDIHREIDDDGMPWERYEDAIWTVGLEDSVQFGERWLFIAGVSYDNQSGKQADNLNPNTLVITPFATETDTSFNAQGGVLFDINQDAQLHFSIARRTRFPTIKDRYSFRFGTALPNPDLSAEQAVHFELGIDGSFNDFDYGINLFHSNLDDAIENVTIPPTSCTAPPCTQLQNIGEQRHRGIELLGGLNIGEQWLLHANYTYLDRDNLTSSNLKTTDTPKHKISAVAQFAVNDAWTFIAKTEYDSDRYSDTTGTRVADGFLTGSLKVSWQPIARLTADIGVNNIADVYYEYEEGFPEPGRSWLANVRWIY
jgi:iron complex outermembrane receptor protein